MADPSVFAFSTGTNHSIKITIYADRPVGGTHVTCERAGDMKLIKREDTAPPWINPEKLWVIARFCHWKNARLISVQQHLRR